MNPQTILKYPFVLLCAFAVTYVLTPLASRLATRLGMIDLPNARRIHSRPTPRAGAIPVFLGFHAGCAAIFLLPWLPFEGQMEVTWWRHLFILSSLLVAVGLADDRWNLKPLVKLGGQTAVAVLAFFFDLRVENILGAELPVAVDFAATLLWFLAIINAFNLIDGMDGLATGLAVIASAGVAGSLLFRHLPGDALILFSLVGACLAFLRFNFHPASVFLGDGGSMFLGFVLAAVAVSTRAKGTTVATIAVPLLAVGVPLFDTVLAVWRRLARGIIGAEKGNGLRTFDSAVFRPDTDHLHHRLIQTGRSHKSVAGLLYALSAALVGVGLLSMIFHAHALGIYLIAFVVLTTLTVRHLARVELWDSGEAILRGLKKPPSRVLTVVLHPPLDMAVMAAGLALALGISVPEMREGELKRLWFDGIPLWVGIPFLVMAFSGTYRRVWMRARFSEYLTLCFAILGGILLATGVALVTGQFRLPVQVHVVNLGTAAETTVVLGQSIRPAIAMHMLAYAAVVLPLIVGARAFPRAVQDAMAWVRRRYMDAGRARVNTLVYGAGNRCTLFLRAVGHDLLEDESPRRVVGLIDDDRNMVGRIVFGYRVLGDSSDLPALLDSLDVREVVVTATIGQARREPLLQLARERGVAVMEWRTGMVPLAPDAGCEDRTGRSPGVQPE